MSDNWSAFSSLPTKGDYIEWSFTIDSTNADYLNGLSGAPEWTIAVRCAITAAPPPATSNMLFCVNDWVQVLGITGWDGAGVGAGWQDAARFQYSNPATGYSAFAFGTLTDRQVGPSFVSGDPTSPVWIAGTNTIRVVNLDSNQLDVDNVALVVGGHQIYVGDDGSFIGPEPPPADYNTHVNGSGSWSVLHTGSAVWVLKAPDGTTGSYVGDPTITFEKACRTGGTEYTFTVHVRDGATDMAGEVGLGVVSGGTTIIDRQTLVAGRATLTGDLIIAEDSGIVWYGGDADYAPESLDTPSSPINCGGWLVGRVGVGI